MKLKSTAVPSYGRPCSRYYGDMSPRTMHEAFGPHTAPLYVTPTRRAVRLRFVLAFILAVAVAAAMV